MYLIKTLKEVNEINLINVVIYNAQEDGITLFFR